MSKILYVDCCVRNQSRTRILAKCLLDCLGTDYDKIDITNGCVKPLGLQALEQRNEKIKSADYSDDMFALARQFAEAETIVIAAPFWDLSFPSFLKIYLENVLVTGLTFTYQSGSPKGLCNAKRLYYVTTSGGAVSPDFGFAYVKALAQNFFQISEIKCFCAEGLDIVGNDAERIVAQATEKIRREMPQS